LEREECTIFIVDDDSSLSRALARLLKFAGYQNVHNFLSAEDFLHFGCIRKQSILILDLKLPGMSGIDLLAHLRNAGLLIPVILISAHDEELRRALDLNHDSVAILHKPFEENELFSAISSIEQPSHSPAYA
jgi:FixJ family two-component response regulator